MIRKQIFKLIRGGLLALAVVVLLLWGWSYVEYDEVLMRRGAYSVTLDAAGGVILWEHSRFARNGPAFRWDREAAALRRDRAAEYWASRPTWVERRGFQFESYDHLGMVSALAPHWFIAGILLLLGSQGLIQRMLVARLPAVARSKRPRLLASIRLLRIAIITAISVTLIVVLCSRFSFQNLGDALVATPIMCGLFFLVPLIGIWLVRKPLAVQKQRLLIHRDRYLCTACGYNLTKNTTGICPECGTESTRLKRKVEGDHPAG